MASLRPVPGVARGSICSSPVALRLRVTQAQLPRLLKHALIFGIRVGLDLDWWNDIVARLICLSDLLLLFLGFAFLRACLQQHFEKGSDRRIWPGTSDRSSARGASIWRAGSSISGLPCEPLPEAGTTESVQAVEKGQRLVEDIGADGTC